jgi:hypothetical protein
MSSKDNRVVVRTGTGLRTDVRANGYALVADEPIGMGGTDSGPTPYDYLLAAFRVDHAIKEKQRKSDTGGGGGDEKQKSSGRRSDG